MCPVLPSASMQRAHVADAPPGEPMHTSFHKSLLLLLQEVAHRIWAACQGPYKGKGAIVRGGGGGLARKITLQDYSPPWHSRGPGRTVTDRACNQLSTPAASEAKGKENRKGDGSHLHRAVNGSRTHFGKIRE